MAANIKRERPDHRRHHRVTAPLFVTIGEKTVRAADWSIGGLLVTDYPCELPAMGEELNLYLTLPFQGFDVAFEAVGEVVRLIPDQHTVAVQFVELGERETDLLRHFIEELVRGNMSSVEDTIQRVDVPVTPVSLQPDVNPKDAMPVKRWSARTIAYTSFYLLLGLVIFGYAAMLVYANFFRMEIRSAVMSATVASIEAHTDGQVVWTTLRPGDEVKAGAVIIRMLDSRLERELEFARISVQERRARVSFLEKRLAEEVVRLAELATVETKKIAQLKLDVAALQAKLRVADITYQRVRSLHQRGYATDARLEAAEKEAITLRSELQSKQLEVASASQIAGRNEGKRYITDERAVGDVEQLKAELDLAQHEVGFARQKLQALDRHRLRLNVRAPFDGFIVKLPRPDRSTVKRGDVIAVVEKNSDRKVVAFLDQDEITRIGLGDVAPIYIPGLDQTLAGRVVAIDRTVSFFEEETASKTTKNSWRRNAPRSGRVTLKFVNPDKVRGSAKYRSGLPAIVIFSQRSSGLLMHAFRSQAEPPVAKHPAEKSSPPPEAGKTPLVHRAPPPGPAMQAQKPSAPVKAKTASGQGT